MFTVPESLMMGGESNALMGNYSTMEKAIEGLHTKEKTFPAQYRRKAILR